ncbi:MAG: exodeoxyribonuclease VII small subunit [Myxococcota bacterium]
MNEHSDFSEQPTSDDAPFEQILDRLQSVVERLEAGDMPLEQSLCAFENGIRLARLGATRLEEAEHRVEVLLADGSSEPDSALDEELESE